MRRTAPACGAAARPARSCAVAPRARVRAGRRADAVGQVCQHEVLQRHVAHRPLRGRGSARRCGPAGWTAGRCGSGPDDGGDGRRSGVARAGRRAAGARRAGRRPRPSTCTRAVLEHDQVVADALEVGEQVRRQQRRWCPRRRRRPSAPAGTPAGPAGRGSRPARRAAAAAAAWRGRAPARPGPAGRRTACRPGGRAGCRAGASRSRASVGVPAPVELCRPSSTRSAAVKSRYSGVSWATKPMSVEHVGAAAGARPKTLHGAGVGRSRPTARCSRVVLPAPFGPTSADDPSRRQASEQSRSAQVRAVPLAQAGRSQAPCVMRFPSCVSGRGCLERRRAAWSRRAPPRPPGRGRRPAPGAARRPGPRRSAAWLASDGPASVPPHERADARAGPRRAPRSRARGRPSARCSG